MFLFLVAAGVLGAVLKDGVGKSVDGFVKFLKAGPKAE